MAFPCLRIPPSKESCAPPAGNPKTQEIRHPHPAFLQNRLLAQVKSQRSINRFRILHGRLIGKLLIKGPHALVRRPPGGLFALGGFGLVLLHFDLKISHHGTTPATRTTFDSTVACAEKMATPRKFRSRDSLDHVAHRMRPPPIGCGIVSAARWRFDAVHARPHLSLSRIMPCLTGRLWRVLSGSATTGRRRAQ